MRGGEAVKRLWTILAIISVVSVFGTFSAAPPIQAQERRFSEAIVREALDVLHMRYPDPEKLNPVALANAAIRGMEQKIRMPGALTQVPSGANYFDHFNAQRDRALKLAGGKTSRLELEFAATDAMLKSLNDSHTYFIRPEAAKEIRARMFGGPEYSGIGIMLACRDGRAYVFDVFDGGPAAIAGVERFDRIVEVDGAMIDCRAVDISAMIRGKAGTSVALTVKRPGARAHLAIAVTRRPIAIPPTEARMLSRSVGYIKVRGFTDRSAPEFLDAARGLRWLGMRALIIDLRGNSGGLVDDMKMIVSALIPRKVPIIRAKHRDKSEIIWTTGKSLLPVLLPVVLIVDETSASAAEITAAAMQEYRRGVVVGARTAGKVELASYASLSGGAMMLVTIARLRTGRGARLENVGVMPNITVSLTLDDLDADKDSQLAAAIREALRRAP